MRKHINKIDTVVVLQLVKVMPYSEKKDESIRLNKSEWEWLRIHSQHRLSIFKRGLEVRYQLSVLIC